MQVAKFITNTSGATWWSNLEKNTSGATLWPNLVSKYIFVRMCDENIGTNTSGATWWPNIQLMQMAPTGMKYKDIFPRNIAHQICEKYTFLEKKYKKRVLKDTNSHCTLPTHQFR